MALRNNQEKALSWEFDEVIERRYQLYTGHLLTDRYKTGKSLTQAELHAPNELVELWRSRVYDLSWYTTAPAHPCARDTCASLHIALPQ